MKKFIDIKALKSSEDCKKFSKRFLHKNLVGGTTTIGREYKQTRRLFLNSANKPLTAVGTLTSLQRNSAKVVEKWLQMSPVFRLIKIFGLVMVLSFTIITESQAEDDENFCIAHYGRKVTCIEKLADETGKNSCGDNCTFKVIEENGKQFLHIYKEDISKPATIRAGAFSPTYYADNHVLDANGSVLPLNNIMMDNDFENIGAHAFAESGAQISSSSGKFTLNNVADYAFLSGVILNGDVVFNQKLGGGIIQSSKVNGNVIFSDNVTDITWYTIGGAVVNGDVIIPESIKNIQINGVNVSYITGQIYCASGIEACYEIIKKGCGKDSSCLTSLDNLLNSKKFSAYPDGCAKLEANLKCTKCKNENFKLNDGYCDRIRYTPAEAAQVLTDDNNNSVTITFKK